MSVVVFACQWSFQLPYQGAPLSDGFEEWIDRSDREDEDEAWSFDSIYSVSDWSEGWYFVGTEVSRRFF